MRLALFFIGLLIISCNEGTTDYESLMVDRVWLNYVGDNTESYQYYYSSKTAKSYLYLLTGTRYTPYTPYKGTPETNPLDVQRSESEGWSEKGSFKIDGNKMMFQDKYKTQHVSTRILKKMQDTTIGTFKYHRIKSIHTDINSGKPTTFKTIWISKIE